MRKKMIFVIVWQEKEESAIVVRKQDAHFKYEPILNVK